MTAEIIIMNAGAIALAADSAATSSHGWGREKVFSSDNKIFELTDNAQVAIMNYGAARLHVDTVGDSSWRISSTAWGRVVPATAGLYGRIPTIPQERK